MAALPRFFGLDLRDGDREQGFLSVGDNIRIDSRGSCRRRPAIVRQATLPVGTAGLYSVDDTLRAAAPNGTAVTGLHPAIFLDYIDATDISGHVKVARLPSGRRALWIESQGGVAAIHSTAQNAEQTVSGSRIIVPWAPRGLLFLGGRLMTLDRSRSYLANSGVAVPEYNDGEGYIRNWEATVSDTDASQNGGQANAAQSSSSPQAIGEYGGQVAVLGIDTVQLWEVGAGGIVGLASTVGGPGTRHPYAMAAMSGDLVYVDTAGLVRSLADDVAAGGKPAEDTIGDEVASLTAQLTGYSDTPRAIYARTMGCYLLASGGTIVCLGYAPGKGKLGWSKWNLPVPVDEIHECRGAVYFRSGRGLYSFRDNAQDDEVDTGDNRPIATAIETVPEVSGGSTWRRLAVTMQGEAEISVRMDDRMGSQSTIVGRAPFPARRTGGWQGFAKSVRLECAAAPAGWRVDGIAWE